MKLHCRLYTPGDIDKLVELWNENAEWGIIDRNQWEKVFYHTPFGPTTIVLATNKNTDEILAQFVFIPTKVSVNGLEIPAYKPCAPIVKKNVRDESGLPTLFNYILKMYNYATRHFISQGIFLLYIMPDPRWIRGFKLIPGINIASFPLWCLPLDKEIKTNLPEGFKLENISPSDSRIDELWSKAARLYNCGIVRNTSFLPWKLSHRNYQFVGITYASRIVGFSAFLYKDIIKGIVICDLLAEDENTLKLTLEITCARASCFKLSLPAIEQINCEKVSILATPLIQKLIPELGFVKNNYKFSLAVHVLGKALSKKDLHPELWYVSAND